MEKLRTYKDFSTLAVEMERAVHGQLLRLLGRERLLLLEKAKMKNGH